MVGSGTNTAPPPSTQKYPDIDKAVIAKDSKKIQAVLTTHGGIKDSGPKK